MSSEYFLDLDGIKGESQDDKHPGSIEIESFSFGISNPSSPGNGAGAGKVSFQDIHFSSAQSKASPNLFQACASGMHLKKATITARKAGEKPLEYLKVTLTDVLVTSYNTGGTANDEGTDGVPVDQFSINFARIDYSFSPQKPDGSLDDGVAVGWDVKANKKA